jgi:hypothetical protein
VVIDTRLSLVLTQIRIGGEEASSMPFPQQPPREFTREDIERIPPGQIGCYALFRGLECVYIGKGDIRERLLAHFDGDNDECERQLILEYHPIC